MICMIAAASLCTYMGSLSDSSAILSVPSSSPQIHHPKLAASHTNDRLPSYYNKDSAHYMGGAHNVALANLSKGILPASISADVPSQASLGGAHNVAMSHMGLKASQNSRTPMGPFEILSSYRLN